MVESRSRKAAFLRDVIRVIGLSKARVLWERVEELDRFVSPSSIDVLTARAVRIDEGIAGTARHLLNAAGRVVLFGRLDTGPLQPDFEPIDSGAAGEKILVLGRRNTARAFHVEQ
jgi:hypothetical protein